MRKDCTVGKLSERNEAGNEADGEEAVRRCSRSCARGVRVAQPRSELYVRDRSRRWTVPLHSRVLVASTCSTQNKNPDPCRPVMTSDSDPRVSYPRVFPRVPIVIRG